MSESPDMTDANQMDASKPPQNTVRRILGVIISLLVYAAAVYLSIEVYRNIREYPRTEDAQVRANVIGVSPQVGGSIIAIHV